MTRTPTETMLLEALEAWVTALDEIREYEVNNPGVTGLEYEALYSAECEAEDAARRAIATAKGGGADVSAVEQGHGRVFPRPDGSFAKCFGPPHCMACQLDADAKERALAMPLSSRLALARALVPGWAVVPREPTEAMQAAAYNAWADGPPLTIVGEAVATYRAMLTAAEETPHGP